MLEAALSGPGDSRLLDRTCSPPFPVALSAKAAFQVSMALRTPGCDPAAKVIVTCEAGIHSTSSADPVTVDFFDVQVRCIGGFVAKYRKQASVAAALSLALEGLEDRARSNLGTLWGNCLVLQRANLTFDREDRIQQEHHDHLPSQTVTASHWSYAKAYLDTERSGKSGPQMVGTQD